MKAMIFSAGLGTRLKPWTNQHPKALAPVNGKSLLQRNVEYLQEFGIREIVVNVHHFADQIEDAVRDNSGWGSRIQISDERDEVLETGGGLLKARPFFTAGEDFLTINVDILTDLNLGELISFHQTRRPLVSLAVSGRKSSRCFLFDNAQRLTGWRNNQSGEERIVLPNAAPDALAFSGISVFSSDFFEYNNLEGRFSLVDAFLQLAPSHQILGYRHEGDKWMDVGKPESLEKAERLFAS